GSRSGLRRAPGPIVARGGAADPRGKLAVTVALGSGDGRRNDGRGARRPAAAATGAGVELVVRHGGRTAASGSRTSAPRRCPPRSFGQAVRQSGWAGSSGKQSVRQPVRTS